MRHLSPLFFSLPLAPRVPRVLLAPLTPTAPNLSAPSRPFVESTAFAIACVGLVLAATDAGAVALMGGTLSLTMVPGLGSCNVSRQVPLTTPQDNFTLSAATPICSGQSAAGGLRADASTGALGLRLTASGPQTTASAQVGFVDRWLLTPPPGTPAGFITLPVSFRLDGSVAPGSQFSTPFGRFLDYNLTISDPNSGVGNPLQSFQALGSISATGSYNLTFNGSLNIRNFNQTLMPMTALVEMMLLVPQLNVGAIDFYNTALTSMTLPAGYTATNSSGVALPFSTPVPEPATAALWLAGLVLVLGAKMRGAAAVAR